MIMIDMRMPEECNSNCPFRDWEQGGCIADPQERNASLYMKEYPMLDRPAWCPLIDTKSAGTVLSEALHVKREPDYHGKMHPYCPRCGSYIERYNSWRPWMEIRFCCYCGQEVSWNG